MGENMRYSELHCKQVIDMKTGKVIGRVNDLRFSEKDYVIKELFVAQPPNCIKRCFPWLFPTEEITVKISDIVQIGEDVIIVQVL